MALLGLPIILSHWLFGAQHHIFTAAVPTKCQTFDSAESWENHDWCKAWFATHRKSDAPVYVLPPRAGYSIDAASAADADEAVNHAGGK